MNAAEKEDRHRRIRLWLRRLPSWEAMQRQCTRPDSRVWLYIRRGDGMHWNPATGATLESAAGAMLRRQGVQLDRHGREMKPRRKKKAATLWPT